MRVRKLTRKILVAASLSLAAFAVLLISLPLWFPWLLRPVAAQLGANYSRYERIGYERFALTGATWTNRTLRVTTARLETFVPTAFLWHLYSAQPPVTPFVTAGQWTVDSKPLRPSQKSVWQEASGWVEPVHEVPRWIPTARLTNGVIRLPGATIEIAAAWISNQTLTATVDLPKPLGRTAATLTLATSGHYRLLSESGATPLRTAVDVAAGPTGIRIDGSAAWHDNPVEFTVLFARTGSWPQAASVSATNIHLPTAVLQLPGYEDLTGSATGHWMDGRFTVDLKGHARPILAETNLPVLDLVLRAHGTTNEAVIDSARLTSPSLQAVLSREVTLHRWGPLLTEPASMQVSVDLDKQPWLPLQGQLDGEAYLYPGEGRIPSGRFHVAGNGVASQWIEARTLDIRGGLEWPLLTISSAEATFDDDSVLSVRGTLDVPRKITGQGRFSFQGPLLNRWLPADFAYAQLAATGTFSGPLKSPVHAGTLRASNVDVPHLKTMQVSALWSGTVSNLDSFTAWVQSSNSVLQASGSLEASTSNLVVQLQELNLLDLKQPALTLTGPAQISFVLPDTNRSFSVMTTPLAWRGPAGKIELAGTLDWPRSGNVQSQMRNVSSEVLSDFLRGSNEPLTIRRAEFSAAWTNGPVAGTLALELSEPSTNEFLASLKADLDDTGLSVSNLTVTSRNGEVAKANGFVPLHLEPGTTVPFQLLTNSPLHFNARTYPGPFWDIWGKQAGLDVANPDLSLSVSGSWNQLEGQVRFTADRAALAGLSTNFPPIEKVSARLRLNREEARLDDLSFQVQGQPVFLTARLPMGEGAWSELIEKRLPRWELAAASLRIENANLAVASRFFPRFVAPQGDLNAYIYLEPGLKLRGELTVEGARTPPIEGIGVFRDIRLRLGFEDRLVRLQTAVAQLGGSPITLTGSLDLMGTNWLQGDIPPFQVVLHGSNVALSRQPESIVRSDLNLAVTKTNGAPAMIAGTATLKDSYYLSDLNDLIPGKVATAKKRPPYFSIEDPALADWRLAVRVTGERFLKIRSPLFIGEVSANLRLSGTLKDPIALGDARADSGTVRFPFATLQVGQGLVTLSSDDPYHPRLNVSATTRQYSYDIRMEVTGPVDAPLLQFTSTPPLSSEQIVLMVTAGELPRGELNLTAQQRAQGLAFFLGRDFLAKLGIGDQGEQRLILKSGQEVSEQGKPTYDFEYRLDKRWSVTGGYDRYGDFNAGLKWQVYSK